MPFQNFPDDTTDVAPGINGEDVTLDCRIHLILNRSGIVEITGEILLQIGIIRKINGKETW